MKYPKRKPKQSAPVSDNLSFGKESVLIKQASAEPPINKADIPKIFGLAPNKESTKKLKPNIIRVQLIWLVNRLVI
ncbi:MAG: hypothetical protein IJV97_01400 [Alphaproteobacteria bacterium]|nr:hypothetical protein [Alphaproteobacteria bacterium]